MAISVELLSVPVRQLSVDEEGRQLLRALRNATTAKEVERIKALAMSRPELLLAMNRAQDEREAPQLEWARRQAQLQQEIERAKMEVATATFSGLLLTSTVTINANGNLSMSAFEMKGDGAGSASSSSPSFLDTPPRKITLLP